MRELKEIETTVANTVLQNAEKQIAETTRIYKNYLIKTSEEMKEINRDMETANERRNETLKGFFLGKFGIIFNIVLILVFFSLGFFLDQSLIAKKALEGQEQKIIKNYLNELITTTPGIITLKELELKWASNEKNVSWADREKTLQNYKENVEWAKENFKK